MHGTTSNIRRNIVSEVHRDVLDTQTVVYDIRNILKSQEVASGQPQSVNALVLRPSQNPRLLLPRPKTGR